MTYFVSNIPESTLQAPIHQGSVIVFYLVCQPLSQYWSIYFLQTIAGINITVSDEHTRKIFPCFWVLHVIINRLSVKRFQRNASTSHLARETITLLA